MRPCASMIEREGRDRADLFRIGDGILLEQPLRKGMQVIAPIVKEVETFTLIHLRRNAVRAHQLDA